MTRHPTLEPHAASSLNFLDASVPETFYPSACFNSPLSQLAGERLSHLQEDKHVDLALNLAPQSSVTRLTATLTVNNHHVHIAKAMSPPSQPSRRFG